jgi:flavin reductase (DIM6/NTAB) family NADH-FMN oxidoreductase RutF
MNKANKATTHNCTTQSLTTSQTMHRSSPGYLFLATVTYYFVVLWMATSSSHSVVALTGIQPTATPPLLDVPVYSLATLNHDGSTNMNILTYATPVSTIPTRVWSLGLFKGTLSEENLRRSGICVLQLLNQRHVDAVPLLGGVSGRDIDKQGECTLLGLPWQDLNDDKDGFHVLPGCTCYIKMNIQGGVVDAGSHVIVPFCEVTDMYSPTDDMTTMINGASTSETVLFGNLKHLSTGALRELGIITEKGRVADTKQFSLSTT